MQSWLRPQLGRRVHRSSVPSLPRCPASVSHEPTQQLAKGQGCPGMQLVEGSAPRMKGVLVGGGVQMEAKQHRDSHPNPQPSTLE